MNLQICCHRCGTPYPSTGTPYQCDCGGVFDVHPSFTGEELCRDESETGIWQYRKSFTLDMGTPAVHLGEGNTPLIEAEFNGRTVFLKLEYANPTGSYKDRGSSVLVSFLKSRGVSAAVEDSSGNAGASFAAYAARAGIAARVFVPESASGPKRSQIEALGADLVSVPGPRAEAARAVLLAAGQGAVYASHAFMPFGLSGIATIAYEIASQLQKSPGTIIAPIGHGGLMYGMMLGFERLQHNHWIEHEPYYLGVQAAGCAPVQNAFELKTNEIKPVAQSDTVAEGVKVSQPVRGESILNHLQRSRGKIVKISEPEIMNSYFKLGSKGFFVEPTSALAWAAMKDQWETLPDPIVLILTGSGLKTKSL